MKKLVLLVFAMFIALLANAQTKTEVAFSIDPKMDCQHCVDKIKNNIRFEKGVKAINPDLKTQLVTVQYDSAKTNPENLIKAFAKIGYKATVVESGNEDKGDKNDNKDKKDNKDKIEN